MQKLYAVKDIKLQAFGRLAQFPNVAVAIREFTAAIKSEQTPWSQYPSDFEVWEIGDYNDERGILIQREEPEFIMSMEQIAQTIPGWQEHKNQINMFKGEQNATKKN